LTVSQGKVGAQNRLGAKIKTTLYGLLLLIISEPKIVVNQQF